MTRLMAFARQLLAKSLRDRKGAISIVTALSFTAVLGFAGLGTEASFWYVKKRSLQGASDSAAFTAAAAMMNGETFASGTPTSAAKAITAQYGLVDGAAGVTVTVNSPPATGPNSGNSTAVEVLISQPQTRLFSALFMPSDPTIVSRAVAAKITTSSSTCSVSSPSGSCGCVLALDKGNVIDVTDSGNSKLNIPGCSMIVNSDDPINALSMSGTAQINAYSVYVVGNDLVTGGAQLNTEKGPGGTSSTPSNANGAYTHWATPQADPNAGVNVPSFSGCGGGTNYSVSSGNTATISPGVYCGGISVNGNGVLNMQPGTYIINGGSGANNSGFTINGNATVNGQGVSIVLTGSGSNYATAQINGGATINLNNDPSSPPPPLNGIAFYQDRNAPTAGVGTPATTTNTFNGGSTQNINGQIYFPNQLVTYTGGATVGSTGAASCTELISYQIKITGNTNFSNNCSGLGINYFGAPTPSSSTVALVE